MKNEVFSLKKIIQIIGCMAVCVALTVGLAGCGPTGTKDIEMTPTVTSPTVVTNGTLTVGVNSSSAPFAGEYKNEMIGLDVDVAAALADELGLKLTLVDINSQDAAALLSEGKVDCVMSWNETKSTSTAVTTAGSYLKNGTALFGISMGNDLQVNTSALQGVKIGAQAGSVSVTTAGTYCGYDNVITYNTLSEAFEALEKNEVTYVACDAIPGAYLATSYDDIVYGTMLDSPTDVTIGVLATKTDLKTALGNALQTIKGNGVLEVTTSKWIGDRAATAVMSS